MNFKLIVNDYGSRDVRYGDDEWDYDWSEDHSYEYNGAKIVTTGYFDVGLFPEEAEPTRGQDIFLVYVSYDTGDSFGRESGRHIDLWAFTDSERAYRLVKAITDDAKEKPDYDFDGGNSLMFDGVKINTSEWKGYFERFDRADVECIKVK